MFQLKHYMLPHNGVMPGARGLKKVVIPAGTKVWCIVYGTKIYWCAYLHLADASRALQGLKDTASGEARHTIALDALIAWNFKDAIPKRIYRSEEYRDELPKA
jgi:hypothetical protein